MRMIKCILLFICCFAMMMEGRIRSKENIGDLRKIGEETAEYLNHASPIEKHCAGKYETLTIYRIEGEVEECFEELKFKPSAQRCRIKSGSVLDICVLRNLIEEYYSVQYDFYWGDILISLNDSHHVNESALLVDNYLYMDNGTYYDNILYDGDMDHFFDSFMKMYELKNKEMAKPWTKTWICVIVVVAVIVSISIFADEIQKFIDERKKPKAA